MERFNVFNDAALEVDEDEPFGYAPYMLDSKQQGHRVSAKRRGDRDISTARHSQPARGPYRPSRQRH
jgi:hypothetical protein